MVAAIKVIGGENVTDAIKSLIVEQQPAEHGEHMSVSPLYNAPEVDHQVMEQLVEWALEQEDHIQTIIFDFLDSPDDESLEETMSKLSDEGIEMHEVSAPRDRTLTDFILAHLPLNLDQLYELARANYASQRPEAAVRTILRKLVRNGKIQLNGDVYAIIPS